MPFGSLLRTISNGVDLCQELSTSHILLRMVSSLPVEQWETASPKPILLPLFLDHKWHQLCLFRSSGSRGQNRIRLLYWSPMAALTNYHKFSSSKNTHIYSLTVLEAGSSEIRLPGWNQIVSRTTVSLEALRENLLFASSSFWWLLPHHCIIFSLSLFLSLTAIFALSSLLVIMSNLVHPSFFEDICNSIWTQQGNQSIISKSLTNYSFKDPFSKLGTFTDFWDYELIWLNIRILKYNLL